jgi:hypothetical protein
MAFEVPFTTHPGEDRQVSLEDLPGDTTEPFRTAQAQKALHTHIQVTLVTHFKEDRIAKGRRSIVEIPPDLLVPFGNFVNLNGGINSARLSIDRNDLHRLRLRKSWPH